METILHRPESATAFRHVRRNIKMTGGKGGAHVISVVVWMSRCCRGGAGFSPCTENGIYNIVWTVAAIITMMMMWICFARSE